MESFANTMDRIDRYDDGMSLNYAMMLRMWSAFDRSVNAFNRKCGIFDRASIREADQSKGESGERRK